MDLSKYKAGLLGVLILLVSSCSDSEHPGYIGAFEFHEDIDQKRFIERLNKSGLDYKLDEEGAVNYRPEDEQAVHNIAFNHNERYFSVPEQTHSWNISQETAKNIVLSKYPNILHNAYMFGPVTAVIESHIDGFSEPSDEVWTIRIHCNKGGRHAVFFVHPDTGQLFVSTAPNTKGSDACE